MSRVVHKEQQFKCLEQVTRIWRSAFVCRVVSLLWQELGINSAFWGLKKKNESHHDVILQNINELQRIKVQKGERKAIREIKKNLN